MKCRSLNFACDTDNNLEIVSDPYLLKDEGGWKIFDKDYHSGVDAILSIPQQKIDEFQGKPCTAPKVDEPGLHFDCTGGKYVYHFTTEYFEHLDADLDGRCHKPAAWATYLDLVSITDHFNPNDHFSIGIKVGKYLDLVKGEARWQECREHVGMLADKFLAKDLQNDEILALFASALYNGERSKSKYKMRWSPVQLMVGMGMDLAPYREPVTDTPTPTEPEPIIEAAPARSSSQQVLAPTGAPPLPGAPPPPPGPAPVFSQEENDATFFTSYINNPDAAGANGLGAQVEPFRFEGNDYVVVEVRDTTQAKELVNCASWDLFNAKLREYKLI